MTADDVLRILREFDHSAITYLPREEKMAAALAEARTERDICQHSHREVEAQLRTECELTQKLRARVAELEQARETLRARNEKLEREARQANHPHSLRARIASLEAENARLVAIAERVPDTSEYYAAIDREIDQEGKG